MAYEGHSAREIKNWKFLFCHHTGFYVMTMGRMHVDLRFILYWNPKISFASNKKSLFDIDFIDQWIWNFVSRDVAWIEMSDNCLLADKLDKGAFCIWEHWLNWSAFSYFTPPMLILMVKSDKRGQMTENRDKLWY